MVSTSFQKVEKEEISNFRFPQDEVLFDAALIAERRNSLDRALSLGNLEHSKIKIFFVDDASEKVVETTVWGVTDKRVILKQGIVIPINRIKAVEL